MISFSEAELAELLAQDVPFVDNTSFGLGISGEAKLEFSPKSESIVLCGIDESMKIATMQGLKITHFKANGAKIEKGEVFLALQGEATKLLRISKTLQNLLEYASSVATYTHKMLESARAHNPNIALLGTRKHMPFAKKLMLKALISGGGLPHRLGLSDSILVFKEHRMLCENAQCGLEQSFKRLKNTFKEHKIIVEVESESEAHYFADLGADILQCERFSVEALEALVRDIKAHFPHILLSATGGINAENAGEYAKSGVDMIVSTAMYRAKICDVKCHFKRN